MHFPMGFRFSILMFVLGYKATFAAPSTTSPVVESICGGTPAVDPTYSNETVTSCLSKSGLTEEALMKMDLSVPGVDDKCFIKCLMNGMGYLSDQGEPMQEKVTAAIKELVPAEYHDLFITTFTTCSSTAEKEWEAEGGRKSVPCKYALSLSICLATAEAEFCKQQMKGN